MREKKSYMVITFNTTAEAMAMEKNCVENAIPGRLIPVPHEISKGCGLAWRIPVKDYHECIESLENLCTGYLVVKELQL